jgi:hypothetical protein
MKTRDLPVSNAVPQPTAPPRRPRVLYSGLLGCDVASLTVVSSAGLLTMKVTRTFETSESTHPTTWRRNPEGKNLNVLRFRNNFVNCLNRKIYAVPFYRLQSLDTKPDWHSDRQIYGIILKPINAHKGIKVYYTHCISPACFGHLCGRLQGGAFQ